MPTITTIEPCYTTRGAGGVQVAINGTGFGASQDTSTVKVGGVDLIVDTWGDTQILGHPDDSPATPLGSQDVVVTVASVAVTAKKALHVYDATDNDANAEIVTGKVSGVYIDGLHVGEIVGEPSIGAIEETVLPFKGQDRFTDKFRRVLTKSCPVSLALAQVNNVTLPLALDGSYDAPSGVITVASPQGADKTERSLLIVLASGVAYVFPRVLISGFSQITLAAQEWQTLPLSFTAYPTADASLDLMKVSFP